MSTRTGDLPSKPGEERPSPERCRELLERILESAHFRRSARLKEFLSYTTDQALAGNCGEINEQVIGERVFGRPADYDTSQDNIVRVNATELRRRIDAYFANEGAAETLVLEIPRGSYCPVFHERPLPPVAPEKPEEDIPPAHRVTEGIEAPSRGAATHRFPIGVSLLSVVSLGLLIVCITLLRENANLRTSAQGHPNKPALNSFWSRFLDSAPQTDIVLADTSFALVEDILKKPIPLSDYLNHNYEHMVQNNNIPADERSDIELIIPRNNGSFGDFKVARRILELYPASDKLNLQFARDYSASAIKRDNVILIGSRKSNPWVDLFMDRLNFTADYDPIQRRNFIRNKSPQAGELAQYMTPADPYASIGYSVIAYLPNPSQTGNALILAGTNSEATDAAGEFLTSEESLANFKNKIQKQHLPHFEVLLRTSQLNGTSFRAEIVAYRLYAD